MNTELNINEIFYSLQGEAREVGLPTVFVRLTGCPLRCSYCDTEYAFKGNNLFSIDAVLTEIKKYNTKFVCVTGGSLSSNFSMLVYRFLSDSFDDGVLTSMTIDTPGLISAISMLPLVSNDT
jgi:7-carboxy-7-deazaguanine synthase